MATLKQAIVIGAGAAAASLALAGAMPRQAQGDLRAAAEKTIASWPEEPKKAGEAMLAKYGAPSVVGEKLIVWPRNGPWIETVLMRDPIDHRWPKPHKDVLAQSIHYRVPVERFDDLVEYDGSIIAERTRGTLSARCDKEEMNYLAINLANDVATGKKTVAQARQAYVEAVMAFMKGAKPEYTTGLRFSVASGGTGDPDQPEPKIGAQ